MNRNLTIALEAVDRMSPTIKKVSANTKKVSAKVRKEVDRIEKSWATANSAVARHARTVNRTAGAVNKSLDKMSDVVQELKDRWEAFKIAVRRSNIGRLVGRITKLTKRLWRMTAPVRALSQGFVNLGKKIARISFRPIAGGIRRITALTKTFAVASAVAFAGLTKTLASYEKRQVTLGQLIGKQLSVVKDFARQENFGAFGQADIENAIAITAQYGMSIERSRVLVQSLRDVAVATGKDMSTAMTAVSKAMFEGESELAEGLKLRLKDEALTETAKRLYGEKMSALTDLQKQEVRYRAILEQTSKWQGIENKMLKTASGQIQVLKARFKSMSEALAKRFQPAIMAVLKLMTDLTVLLSKSGKSTFIDNIVASIAGGAKKMSDFAKLVDKHGVKKSFKQLWDDMFRSMSVNMQAFLKALESGLKVMLNNILNRMRQNWLGRAFDLFGDVRKKELDLMGVFNEEKQKLQKLLPKQKRLTATATDSRTTATANRVIHELKPSEPTVGDRLLADLDQRAVEMSSAIANFTAEIVQMPSLSEAEMALRNRSAEFTEISDTLRDLQSAKIATPEARFDQLFDRVHKVNTLIGDIFQHGIDAQGNPLPAIENATKQLKVVQGLSAEITQMQQSMQGGLVSSEGLTDFAEKTQQMLSGITELFSSLGSAVDELPEPQRQKIGKLVDDAEKGMTALTGNIRDRGFGAQKELQQAEVDRYQNSIEKSRAFSGELTSLWDQIAAHSKVMRESVVGQFIHLVNDIISIIDTARKVKETGSALMNILGFGASLGLTIATGGAGAPVTLPAMLGAVAAPSAPRYGNDRSLQVNLSLDGTKVASSMVDASRLRAEP